MSEENEPPGPPETPIRQGTDESGRLKHKELFDILLNELEK